MLFRSRPPKYSGKSTPTSPFSLVPVSSQHSFNSLTRGDHSTTHSHLNTYRERAKDLMPPGQESVVILIDYKTTTLRTNPSISTARKVSLFLPLSSPRSHSAPSYITQPYTYSPIPWRIIINFPLLVSLLSPIAGRPNPTHSSHSFTPWA